MYRIVSPSRTSKPSSLTHSPYGRGAGGEARDPAGQENSSGLCTSQVSLTLNLLAKNRLGVCKTPILLRKTALLAASIKLPDKPLPPPPAAPSRLPARVLRPSGARPGPTGAGAETGAERCPLGTCAPIGGGRVSPAGSVGSRQSATGARSPLTEGGVTPQA